MEFSLEMIIKATMHNLRITEVPTALSPDQRGRAPHLRRYRDGWRSLRFYLLMSPRWFFAIPGLLLLGIGLMAFIALLRGPVHFGAVTFDYHSLLYAMATFSLAIKACSVRVCQVHGHRDRIASARTLLVSSETKRVGRLCPNGDSTHACWDCPRFRSSLSMAAGAVRSLTPSLD
jgi:hypothetical protein